MTKLLRRLVAPFIACAILIGGPILPAHAGATSNYLQNKFIDWFLRGQTFTAPTTVYIALTTSTPTAASCGTEVSGSNYGRVQITSSLSNWAGTQSSGSTVASTGTSGQTSNNGTVSFATPSASWGTVTGMCAFDASTGGNYLWYATLTVAKTINNGDTVTFPTTALTFTLN